MNIGLLKKIEELPIDVCNNIKKIGDDCYKCIKKWVSDNWNKPIENPLENYIQYGNFPNTIKELENDGYWDITRAYLKDAIIAAGCEPETDFYGTSEIAEQAGCSYETAKKWAAKNCVKKIKFGKKTIYQWTEENLNSFINRGRK